MNIAQNAEVGIAAPVILTFSNVVTNKAAVVRALSLTTSLGTGVTGAWAWSPDHDGYSHGVSELHFRPTSSPVSGTPFWPAGITVSVSGALAGLDYGDGFTGHEDLHLTFRIRPQALVVTADAQTHRVTVFKSKGQIGSFATTLDAAVGQSWSLAPGVHVITDKLEQRIGSAVEKQAWSMRLGNIGAFIHSGAPTHGDVGLNASDAKKLYEMARYGDPVIVSNTAGQMDTTYDIDDWNLSVQEWTAKSQTTR